MKHAQLILLAFAFLFTACPKNEDSKVENKTSTTTTTNSGSNYNSGNSNSNSNNTGSSKEVPQKTKDTKSSSFNGVTATINDPDGYTNIRSGPGKNFDISGKVLEGEEFLVKTGSGDWWEVQTSGGTTGYMHKSRVVIGGNNKNNSKSKTTEPLEKKTYQKEEVSFPGSWSCNQTGYNYHLTRYSNGSWSYYGDDIPDGSLNGIWSKSGDDITLQRESFTNDLIPGASKRYVTEGTGYMKSNGKLRMFGKDFSK